MHGADVIRARHDCQNCHTFQLRRRCVDTGRKGWFMGYAECVRSCCETSGEIRTFRRDPRFAFFRRRFRIVDIGIVDVVVLFGHEVLP